MRILMTLALGVSFLNAAVANDENAIVYTSDYHTFKFQAKMDAKGYAKEYCVHRDLEAKILKLDCWRDGDLETQCRIKFICE